MVAFLLVGLEVPSPARSQTWTIDPDPVLSIGGLTEDPNYILSNVVGGLRLEDGRVVLADRFTNGLRVYSADGTFIDDIGGEGEGPGEYEYIRAMDRCAGFPVVAFDLHWDMKLYNAQLRLSAERSSVLPGINGTPYKFDCAPSGHWIATGWGGVGDQFEEGYFKATAPVGRQTQVAIGPDRVYLGEASEYRIEVFDLQGNALPPVEWPGPDREISRAHIERYSADLMEGVTADRAPSFRRWLRDLPEVKEFPAYDALRGDQDGNLWVRYFQRPGETAKQWLVFDPHGQELGTISLPDRMSILDFGSGFLLVVELDDMDVATVALYRLVKS